MIIFFISNRNFQRGEIQLSNLSPKNIISNYICELDTDQIQIRLFAVNEVG